MDKNKNFLITNEQSKFKIGRQDEHSYKLDEVDRKILSTLMWDCRLSYREVARRTRLSVTTVINRLRKLKENKIIRGYSIYMDPSKLGYGLVAVINVTMPNGIVKGIEDKLAEFPNICATYIVTGQFDTVIIAKFKDSEELSDFLKALQSMNSVEKTETHIVMKTVKEDFRHLFEL